MNFKTMWRKIMNESQTEIENVIHDLIDSGAVRFDLHNGSHRFLRLTSTRELLTDEIRDKLLSKWQNAFNILSQSLKDKLDLSKVKGLCISQSDWGFDCHSLTFREDHHEEGHYRW